ncbi:MAG: hypothetical protein RBR62_02565 [Bacteroidales bacterium]|jgi:hypothetical protein|nr:hypothetical protein [Bacteroidales bacterium]
MESNEIVFGPELFFFYVLFHALGIGVLTLIIWGVLEVVSLFN